MKLSELRAGTQVGRGPRPVAPPDSIITQREEEPPPEEEPRPAAEDGEGGARRRRTNRTAGEEKEKSKGRRQRDFDPAAAAEDDSGDERRPGRERERTQAAEDVWTQSQQRLLELALQQFPRGTAERWDRIAKVVPGKSKVRGARVGLH